MAINKEKRFLAWAKNGDKYMKIIIVGCGKIGIDGKSRFFADEILIAVGFEFFAKIKRSPTLPDDGVINGISR